MIATLVIPSSVRRAGRLDFGAIRRDLVEGIRFVAVHKQVRPWMLGIAFTFTAAGAVFSLGASFVREVLSGGDQGFAFLIGFLGTGMIVGLLAVGALAKRVQKDVLFSSSILLTGVSLIALAAMGSLDQAIPIASALGFFGGAAYSTGYSLMHETTRDDLRGRTFSAAYTIIRIGTLVGLGLFPFVAGLIGSHRLDLPWGVLDLPGSRTTLWIAGLIAVGGGIVSMRAIGARAAMVRPVPVTSRGYFIVFEGGDGAGKSTQISGLVGWLKARGEEVVTTREPGGTAIGERIRDLLLDPSTTEMGARTEALLYAADRAQHVSEVIRPALESGRIVVSDRFVDSSLAYQGMARGLGLEEIYQISEWATGGLLPDVVFYLKLDPEEGLRRVEGERDRIESEEDDFHRRVSRAYIELAAKYPHRFVVLDAARPSSEIHRDVITALEERSEDRDPVDLGGRTLQRPGPLPR
jgi:dTMP kinase